VLHGLHHQHVRPWELFVDEESKSTVKPGSRKSSVSADSLTSNSSNSFEDEPWIQKYKKRNLIRQIFDRETYIDEPALRQIQDTIFLQSVLMATGVSAVIVAIFLAVPAGHLL
jgi:hypothetical protein